MPSSGRPARAPSSRWARPQSRGDLSGSDLTQRPLRHLAIASTRGRRRSRPGAPPRPAADGLDVGEFPRPEGPQLAAIAAELDSPEGEPRVGGDLAVDEDRA